MTFLQRTFGKNYKWIYIARFSFMSEAGDKLGFFAKYLSAILLVVANAYVWFLAGTNSSIFTYLLVGRVYFELTSNNYYYRLTNLIISGNINKMLYPVNFFVYQYFESLGTRLIKNALSIGGTLLGVLICLLWFAKIDPPSIQTFYLIPMTFIGFTIYQAIGIIVGSITFWLKNPRDSDGIHQSIGAVIWIFAGVIVPLSKMPTWLGDFLALFPFSFLLHHPMQIYLGKYNNLQILQTFVGGIMWCITLWILARLVFKAGLKRNESVGL